MKFNYKIPLNELVIKPPKLKFCLAKYKFYAGCFRKNVEHFLTLYMYGVTNELISKVCS